MTIDEYFNEVQEYVKQNIEDKSQIDEIIKVLNRDNIQANVNQDYNNKVSIEECGEKILKQLENQDYSNQQPHSNELAGERGMNTMENVISFSDFKLNEDFTNSSASDIIDEIEELSNYPDQNNEDELREKLIKINDLISDLRFQCE